MERNTLENGLTKTVMDTEFKSGSTDLVMKVLGLMTKHMALVNFFILMEIRTKENGRTIKLMAAVAIIMQTEQRMKEIGNAINSMATGLKAGLMEHAMKAIIKTA